MLTEPCTTWYLDESGEKVWVTYSTSVSDEVVLLDFVWAEVVE